MVSTQEGARTVRRWFEDIFTRGDLKVVDEVVAEDLVTHGQGGDPGTQGAEAFKDWLRWYRAAFTDPEWTVHDVIVAGDKIVARYSGKTTYRGGLLDIPPSDQRVTESGILIYRIEDGKVKELGSEMSDLQVVQQLGAFPVPKRMNNRTPGR